MFPEILPKSLFDATFSQSLEYRYAGYVSDEWIGGSVIIDHTLLIGRGKYREHPIRFRVRIAKCEASLQYSIMEIFRFSTHLATVVSIMTQGEDEFPVLEGPTWPLNVTQHWGGKRFSYEPIIINLASIERIKRNCAENGWIERNNVWLGKGSAIEGTLTESGSIYHYLKEERHYRDGGLPSKKTIGFARRIGPSLEIQHMRLDNNSTGLIHDRELIVFDPSRRKIVEIVTGWSDGLGEGPGNDYSGPNILSFSLFEPLYSIV